MFLAMASLILLLVAAKVKIPWNIFGDCPIISEE